MKSIQPPLQGNETNERFKLCFQGKPYPITTGQHFNDGSIGRGHAAMKPFRASGGVKLAHGTKVRLALPNTMGVFYRHKYLAGVVVNGNLHFEGFSTKFSSARQVMRTLTLNRDCTGPSSDSGRRWIYAEQARGEWLRLDTFSQWPANQHASEEEAI